MPQKYFLFLFIGYLPFYLALLLFLKTKIQGYTIRSHMVSYLATSNEPWRSIFNSSTILYGTLSLVLPLTLHDMLGNNRLVALGAAFLLATGAATILVGFFPMDRRIKVHNAVGFLAFFCALLTGIVFFDIFYQGLLFFPLMQAINLAVIGTAIGLGLSLLVRRQISSLLEWILFICTIAWNFLLALTLLSRL